jgi:hypothetical protein
MKITKINNQPFTRELLREIYNNMLNSVVPANSENLISPEDFTKNLEYTIKLEKSDGNTSILLPFCKDGTAQVNNHTNYTWLPRTGLFFGKLEYATVEKLSEFVNNFKGKSIESMSFYQDYRREFVKALTNDGSQEHPILLLKENNQTHRILERTTDAKIALALERMTYASHTGLAIDADSDAGITKVNKRHSDIYTIHFGYTKITQIPLVLDVKEKVHRTLYIKVRND